MKYLKNSVFILLFLICAGLCQQIIARSLVNQQAKMDYAEITHIKYGLFSVDAWKEKLIVIVRDEINGFNFSKVSQKQLKEHIQAQLSSLIDKVYDRVKEGNKGSAKGRLKNSIIDTFVNIDKIKEGIPEYADSIMAELTKSQTERQVKGMLNKQVDKYFDKTYESEDEGRIQELIAKTETIDIDAAKTKLSDDIYANENLIYQWTWAMIGFAVILFLMAGLSKNTIPKLQFVVLLLTLLALLLVGVTTPMIDMEAKISELSFVLLDHPISFINQILYFQSKSIMDVFGIMIVHKDLQMKIVGILMVTFSIFFPVLKLISSFFYYHFQKARDSKIVQFFVLKSGKWSMADVMIIAIFMAYIGFNGIIASQLTKLSERSADVMVLATNGTSLQPGFYLFLTYAVLALFLSSFLTRKSNDQSKQS